MSYLSVNNPPSANAANRQLDLPAPMPVPAPPGAGETSKLRGNNPSVLTEYNLNTEI